MVSDRNPGDPVLPAMANNESGEGAWPGISLFLAVRGVPAWRRMKRLRTSFAASLAHLDHLQLAAKKLLPLRGVGVGRTFSLPCWLPFRSWGPRFRGVLGWISQTEPILQEFRYRKEGALAVNKHTGSFDVVG